MNESEMQAELERLRAENAKLKSKEKGGISLKVSEKGAVSLYGMGRFPVTLYFSQSANIAKTKNCCVNGWTRYGAPKADPTPLRALRGIPLTVDVAAPHCCRAWCAPPARILA